MSKRPACVQCLRPQSACICRWITSVAHSVEVLILQHPLEVSNPKGSARLLHLSLPHSRLVTGEVFDVPALLEAPPGTGWEANISWKPLSYSKFDFYTTKSVNESTGLGDFTLAKKYGASWTHAWDPRLTSIVSLSRNDDEFVGNVRNDNTDAYGLKLNYKLMRWLSVGGEYNFTTRDSNVSGFNYKKNLYMITFGVTL